MKHFLSLSFLLIATALQAQTWTADQMAASIPAGTQLVNNAYIHAQTVYTSNTATETAGVQFDNFVLQKRMNVRVADWPSATAAAGTEQSGSTPVLLTAKKTGTLTLYYRRQVKDNAYTPGDGKDVQLYQGTTALSSSAFAKVADVDANYAYCQRSFVLDSAASYVICAKGTTLGLMGFNFEAEGSSSTTPDPTTEVIDAFRSAPAFPGAEGHGRFVTGGRGGEVRHVTNLNDSGTGSFRAAVSGNTAKIVVFDVAGVIALNTALTIGDNTTIEGQTAPSPGITLRYYTVQPGNNNIIRFLRIRRGQERDVNDGADASWQRNKTGIIFDHCSFSWSIDEVASFYDNNNFTMQWCTIAESLTNPGHSKGAHGYGGIWGGKLASFHHNLIAHVSNRGPRFNGARYEWTGYTNNQLFSEMAWANPVQAENVDMRNCVMYNAQGTCYGGPGGGQINMVNNYFKAGPGGAASTAAQQQVTLVTVAAEGNSSGHPNIYGMTSRYYISGNTTETTAGTITRNRDWAGVIYDAGTHGGNVYSEDTQNLYGSAVEHTTVDGVSCVKIRMTQPAPIGAITTHTAADAFQQVLAHVGASLYRDDVDTRYVTEATNGTCTYTGSVTGKPGLIDLVADVNGYTELTFGTNQRPADFDSDGDGMPDAWESEHGLNPQTPLDAALYTLDSRGYYTNVEVYCNSLVESIMKSENQQAQTMVEEYYPALEVPTTSVQETLSTPRASLILDGGQLYILRAHHRYTLTGLLIK